MDPLLLTPILEKLTKKDIVSNDPFIFRTTCKINGEELSLIIKIVNRRLNGKTKLYKLDADNKPHKYMIIPYRDGMIHGNVTEFGDSHMKFKTQYSYDIIVRQVEYGNRAHKIVYDYRGGSIVKIREYHGCIPFRLF